MSRLLRAALAPMVRDLWVYVAVPALFVLAEIVDHPGLSPATYVARFGFAFIAVVCLGLPAHALYAHLGERVFPERFRWWELGVHALFVGFSVFAGTELAIVILAPLAPLGATPQRLGELRGIAWIAGFAAIGTYSVVSFGLSRSRQRLEKTELRESEARQAAFAAQVQALQARIQPHFLFNCLNTVAGLIEEDPKRATEAVERLSDLFRYALDSSKRTSVPLQEELLVLGDFLELEALRYGGRLTSRLDVDPESTDAQVPPLILQPMVENAVLHGIADRREGGTVEIATKVDGDRLVLRVEDDGPGPGRSGHRGSGSALADLRRRLALLYDGNAEVVESAASLGGYRIEIRLPLRRAAGTAS